MAGPFTVVWEAFDDPRPGPMIGPWNRLTATYPEELDAVRKWGAMKVFENTRPVSVTPEPNWSAYVRGDGKTPVTR